MNKTTRRIIMDRMNRENDYARNEKNYDERDYARRAMDYARRAMDYARRNNDMRLSDPIGTEPEYPQEMMMWDGKQGVKGTGPYGIGGRLYSRNHDYRGYDDDDYEMDHRRRRTSDYSEYEMDGHHPSGLMKLKKKDFKNWEHNLENADGTTGKHFEPEQIKHMAEQIGVKYREYDEKDLCMVANMLYSDYCGVLKNVLPPDKELVGYVKLAQAWLEDPDASAKGSEKLALYYWCIVDDED